MNETRWSNELLDAMSKIEDPPAAEVMACVLDGGHEAIRQILVFLRHWQAQPNDALPPSVYAYFTRPVELPAWVEPARLELTEKLTEVYGPYVLLAIALGSFPAFFTDAVGARAFVVARTLRSDVLSNRLIEIVQLAIYAGSEGGLRASPKGPGTLAVQKLRLIHVTIRALLRPHWDAAWGSAILSQEDLASATLGFALRTIDALPRLGIVLTADEKEAIFHTWKFMGYLLGLRDELLPVDVADGLLLQARIAERRVRPSELGTELLRDLTSVVKSFLPFWLRGTVPALMRHVMGAEVADLLRMPKAGFSIVAYLLALIGWLMNNDRSTFLWLSKVVRPRLLEALSTVKRRERGKLVLPGELRASWKLK
jgi:hypothetical protein